MPVRITKSWRQALRSIARLKVANAAPGWEFLWDTYTRNQRKAVRELMRKLLVKSNVQNLHIAKRQVPTLTTGQIALHGGLTKVFSQNEH